MKRTLWKFVVILMIVTMISGTALAAGKLSVVQEKFVVLPYGSYHAGYVYAEVKNIGDKPVEFDGGLLELYDSEGNSIESTNYINCYPNILNAGESGYLYVQQSVEEAKDKSFIDDYLLTITGKGSKGKKAVYISVSNAQYQEIEDTYWSNTYVVTDLLNDTAATLYDFSVVYALKDSEGNLLYVTSCQPSYVGIKSGSSLEVRTRVDSDIVEYFEENKIVPATAEAIAYVIIEDE